MPNNFRVFDLKATSGSFNTRPKVNGTNVALITDISDDSQPYIQRIYIDNLGLQDDRFDLYVEGAKISDFGAGADNGGRDWEIIYSTAKRGYLMRMRNADTGAWTYAGVTMPTERKKTLALKTNNDGGSTAALRFNSTTIITIDIANSSLSSLSINPVNNNLYVDGVLTNIIASTAGTAGNYHSKYLVFDVDVDLSGEPIEIAQRIIKFTDITSKAEDWV